MRTTLGLLILGELDVLFYAQQRVGEDDKENLYMLLSKPGVYLHASNALRR
jgi:hypothetical protein